MLEGLRKSIHRDLTSESKIRVPIEGASEFIVTPFPWNLYNTSGSQWNSTNDPRIFSRISDGFTLKETTIGFSATSTVPESLDEIWIRYAEFPM